MLTFPKATKEISKGYSKIKHPVLIVVGADDPFGTIEQARRLNKDIPHSNLKIIPKVAHMIPDVHPKLVVENIIEFYNKNTK